MADEGIGQVRFLQTVDGKLKEPTVKGQVVFDEGDILCGHDRLILSCRILFVGRGIKQRGRSLIVRCALRREAPRSNVCIPNEQEGVVTLVQRTSNDTDLQKCVQRLSNVRVDTRAERQTDGKGPSSIASRTVLRSVMVQEDFVVLTMSIPY